jgi:PadR family transcriptional regulator PadR
MPHYHFLALGGGSAIDCAKGIALCATNGGEIADYEGVDRSAKPQLPLVAINTTAGLLDAIVLAVVGREETGTYGYKITQEVRTVLDLSESTLYPVLRRLQKDGCLTVHDEAFNGRNRRYYQITPAGRARLAEFTAEWEAYTTKINKLFKGEQQ